MKKWMDGFKYLVFSRTYRFLVCVSAICSYGFTIAHPAIGMDDTAVSMYFEEGLAPWVGRWTLFVINRILHINIAEFRPWTVEIFSVFLLAVSVTLWCVLWRQVFGRMIEIPAWCYGVVAAIFISCPMISEVFVFYLHNGICMGYGIVAIALMFLVEASSVNKGTRTRVFDLIVSALLLTTAIGLYESFIVVYVMGAILLFAVNRASIGARHEEICNRRLSVWTINGVVIVAITLAMRTIVLKALEVTFKLNKFSVYDIRYRKVFGDIFSAPGELTMVLKRLYLKYFVNAVSYLPVTILVVSICVIGLAALIYGVRQKDLLFPICFLVFVLCPVGMSMVEGLATRYRSAQYVPMVCALASLIILIFLHTREVRKWIVYLGYALLAWTIVNQCIDINKWFYLDWLKYENAKTVMEQVAYDIKARCDTSKPIAFIGAYTVPFSIASEACNDYASWQYKVIGIMTDPIDVHLKEKYHSGSMGYAFAEMPVVSVLQWGETAFDGTSQQLINFWKMHGIEGFICENDSERIREAQRVSAERNMPSYPKEGYILETENNIIVNLNALAD